MHCAEDDAGDVAHAAENDHRRIMIDSISEKLSGETKPLHRREDAAGDAAERGPMAKASSLTLRVLMPIALAAISSSRMACQARPMRECCRRKLTRMTPSASSTSR